MSGKYTVVRLTRLTTGIGPGMNVRVVVLENRDGYRVKELQEFIRIALASNGREIVQVGGMHWHFTARHWPEAGDLHFRIWYAEPLHVSVGVLDDKQHIDMTIKPPRPRLDGVLEMDRLDAVLEIDRSGIGRLPQGWADPVSRGADDAEHAMAHAWLDSGMTEAENRLLKCRHWHCDRRRDGRSAYCGRHRYIEENMRSGLPAFHRAPVTSDRLGTWPIE